MFLFHSKTPECASPSSDHRCGVVEMRIYSTPRYSPDCACRLTCSPRSAVRGRPEPRPRYLHRLLRLHNVPPPQPIVNAARDPLSRRAVRVHADRRHRAHNTMRPRAPCDYVRDATVCDSAASAGLADRPVSAVRQTNPSSSSSSSTR